MEKKDSGKHILILVSSMRCGGSERVAVKLSEWCSQFGHKVSLVTLSSTDSDFYPIPKGVDRIGLNLESESNAFTEAIKANHKRIQAVRKIIRVNHSNYVVGFGDQCGILGVLASFNTSAKAIFSERKDPLDTPLAGIWRRLQRFAYKRAYMAVALSSGAQSILKKEYPLLPTVVIGNASSFEKLEISDSSNSIPKILFVGRLHQQKGVDILLKAIGILLEKKCAPFYCNIVGDGDRMPELKVLAEQLGITPYVKFVGKSNNVMEWYAQSDIFVLPSTIEGFPNTLIEAMSTALPVVASECGSAVKDIFNESYEVGLTFPVNDSYSLADALKLLIENNEVRDNFRINSFRRSKDYTETFISGEWLKILT